MTANDTHTYDTRGVYDITLTSTALSGTYTAESDVIVGVNPISMGFNQDFSQSQFYRQMDKYAGAGHVMGFNSLIWTGHCSA